MAFGTPTDRVQLLARETLGRILLADPDVATWLASTVLARGSATGADVTASAAACSASSSGTTA